MEISFIPFEKLTPHQLLNILRIRSSVFMVEQQFHDETDIDDIDEKATHGVAVLHGRIVGTCRVFIDDHGHAHLGRLAVAADAREAGAGTALLAAARKVYPDESLYANAQSQVAEWYSARGFVISGEEFDDGLPPKPHRTVIAPPYSADVARGNKMVSELTVLMEIYPKSPVILARE